MSQWAGIEPAAETSVAAPPSALATRPAPAPRLRRQDQIVLGSIDSAAHVLQRHAREVVLGSAVFLLPAIVVNLVVSTLLYDRFESVRDHIVSLPELISGIDAATGVETLLAYVGIVSTSLAAALIGGYLATVYVRFQLGQQVTLGSCLLATAKRLPGLLVSWLAGHCWLLLAAWAMVAIPGGSLAPFLVVLAPGAVVLLTIPLLISPVLVIERRGPFAAARRAVSLVRSRFGAALSFVLAAGVIGLGVRFGITFLPRLAQATGFVTFGSYGWLVEGVAGQLAQLLAVPLVALSTVAFYVQLRVHVEGMDIVIAADRAFPAGPA